VGACFGDDRRTRMPTFLTPDCVIDAARLGAGLPSSWPHQNNYATRRCSRAVPPRTTS